MMESQPLFITNPTNFQFLSVCHYINIFGIYFYNNDLIKLDERYQSVPVLNTLFDYLSKSKNETEAKYKLLKKVLKGSDLYGGRENETLEIKYVNETFQYIISMALFSHYGNINGYLAKIINRADSVNYSAFKEMVLRHLSESYITKEYCASGNYSSKLSPLAIQKIYQDHILPIFPQPEEDMSIINVNYIYAMVGLKMFRSMSNKVNNLTFNEYTLISRELDMQEFNETSFQVVLELFSVPALFFYAFNYKNEFRKYENNSLNDRFWIKAYEKLFQSINSSMIELVDEIIESSLVFKFDKQLEKIETRTQLATRLLKVFCRYDKLSDVSSSKVSMYKSLYLWVVRIFLPRRCHRALPDLEAEYNEQFTEIKKTYNEIMKQSIEEILVQSNFTEKMNTDTAVEKLVVPNHHPICIHSYCVPPENYVLNSNVFLLLGIFHKNGKRDVYAIIKDETTLKLLHAHGRDPKFAQAVVNKWDMKLYVDKNLKKIGEDYKKFVENAASIKSDEFIKQLKQEYYDLTASQKVFYYVKMFIPFYNCVENVKSGTPGETVTSCSLDIFTLLPVAGFAAKLSSKITTSLQANVGKLFMVSNSFSRVSLISKLPLITSLKEITKVAFRTIASEILSRKILKDFVVASLRTLDPGFELMYKLSTGGYKLFYKLLSHVHSRFKEIPALEKFSSSINSVLSQNSQNAKLIADQTGLVPMTLAKHRLYDSVRYFYPGGSHFFGPMCLKSHGKVAELRKIEGSSRRIPVISEKLGNQIFYKQYFPKSGKVDNSKLTMGKNDVLHRFETLLKDLIIDNPNFKVTQNYHVYHNTIEWNKVPRGGNSQGNIPGGNAVDANIPAPLRNDRVQVTNVQELQRINVEDIRGFTSDRNIHEVVRGGQLTSIENIIDPNIQSTSTGQRIFNEKEIQELDNLDSIIHENTQTLEVVKSPEVSEYYHKKFDYVIPEHHRRPSVIKEVPRKVEYPDDIPGTSQQTATNLRPSVYKDYLTEPIYKDYVNVLLEWKNSGLFLRTENLQKVNVLRTSVNKLALFQIDKIPIPQTPIKTWCLQKIRGQNNIDFLINLKGKDFFFNDMTLLSNVQPNLHSLRTWNPYSQEVEVLYHLNIDSQYGFVDLTRFHHQLQNQYVTFSDQLFLIRDTSFAEDGKVLNVFLDTKSTSKELWLRTREQDIIDLRLENIVVKYPRLQNLEAAANYMVQNAPKCSFKLAKNYLKNFVLSTKPSSKSIIPTYNVMANEFKNMKYTYVYDSWRVHQDRYILDVLYELNLQRVIDLNEAMRRIVDVHGISYHGNVAAAYDSYRGLEMAERRIRFEDYYVLHYRNHFEGNVNQHAKRQYAAAVTRLALRQAEEEFTNTPVKLFASGAISKEMKAYIMSLYNNHGRIRFNDIKYFNRARKLTPITTLNEEQKLTHTSSFLVIKIENQAGIVNLNSVLEGGKDIYAVTKKFQFLITDITNKRFNGENVMLIKMRDIPTPTENRMALMAQNLHELFSTDTKFYCS
ncbi:uncharacterized protein LOC122504922 [Leptopilina heterotoma]|uniref:uncharacterized protein LOC122504922 n=1 Tax=Leptopilina heterotoma TaxID=63436 RepID=UPI001CA95C2A|nr:uncharacterized protein LOC122504922 [Leptopilina heterotoma]